METIAMRATCISSFTVALVIPRWTDFSGRAQDNFDEKTRSVTQSGDHPSVNFDKRTRCERVL